MIIVNLKTITFSLFVNELLLTIHDQISIFFWGGRWVNRQLYHAAWCWSTFFKLILLILHLVIFFPIFYLHNKVFFGFKVWGILLKFNTLNDILVELVRH